MTRIMFWFLAILIVSVVAVWLADNPGEVAIDFQGRRIYASFASLTFVAVGLAALTGGTVWLVGWIKRDMPLLGSNQVVKRQQRGLKLLNQSLVALSAGDHKLAGRLAGQAEVLLPPQPMVHLIAAEAAQRGGNHQEAAKRFAALEETDEGRFLGLRGLLSEARRTGRESEALRLARVAFEENRKSPWVLKTLFALEVAAGNWEQASTALSKVMKEGLVADDIGKRHQATLAYAEAAEHNLKGDRDLARKGFKKAMSLQSAFYAAVSSLARLELSGGNGKKAEKIIMDAWGQEPHPSYAKLYKELDAAEAPADWLARVRALVAKNPDHPESLLLLTDALMDAQEYSAAKPVLDRLLAEHPTRTAWQYKLALVHALGEDPDPVETALEHALEGAIWQCTDCGHQPRMWAPLCESCDGFDTTLWQNKADIVSGHNKAEGGDPTIALLADTQV